MTVSRRSILLQGSVIGAGIIAASTPGMVALAQGQPKLRRSLTGMALNDPILSTWRDGVRLLKAASGNISWASFANIHGDTPSHFNLCPHRNWYFLPWHRGYLLMYERVVRQLTGNNDFALPYWDWTAERHLPEAYSNPTFNGQPNALFEPMRTVQPTDTLGDGSVGQGVINQILSEAPFETFGSTRPPGQNSTDPMWVKQTSGIQGTLENNPHNTVHGFVGGIMSSAQSSLDPIFMMHHCNIDRIWWMWNQGGGADSPDPLWTGMTFTNNFFNPDGSPYSPKVTDLFTPEPLGYTYDDTPQQPPPGPAQPPVLAQYDKFKSLYAVKDIASVKAAGIATYVSKATEAATPTKYAEIPVEVDPAILKTVANRKPLSSGTSTLSLNKVREQIASGPRAYAFIRDLDYTEGEQTIYRVFLDCDYLSPNTPIGDKHYVGAFAFFGPSHGDHGGVPVDKPSLGIDLTGAIQRIYGAQPELYKQIRVQIQPVANKASAAGKAGTCKPSRVEIAVVSA